MNRIAAYLRFVCVLLLAAGFAACTAEPIDGPAPDNGSYNADGTLALNVGIEIPGMSAAATRAAGRMGERPSYDDLNLYLLIFEEDEGLTQYAPLERTPGQPDETHGHSELVTFRATLNPTEKRATIHLIATDQPDFSKKIVYGTEDRVITLLYTDDNHEAYWQRLNLGCRIPSVEQTTLGNEKYDATAVANLAQIRTALSHVPMIRNFCRVSVTNNAAGFTLKGLYVVNTVDRGSVAPYVAAKETADQRFVAYYDEVNGRYAGKSYAAVSAQDHIGTLPTGVTLINTGTDPAKIATKSETADPDNDPVQPVYFYERPARINSTERTYVILRGRRVGSESDSYYKLDLGYTDETVTGNDNRVVGLFAYYNLLRNFDYRINLKNVEGNGYGSFADAANGAVFNNFSAAVEARNMKSISDGDDMIFVDFTSYVFTEPNQQVTLHAQYRTNVNDQKGGTERNDLISYKLEDDGDVVAGIVETLNHQNSLDAWNSYVISGGTPTDILKQQTLYIYRGNRAANGEADYGLYRVITIFSHTPWSLLHIDTFPGLWESMDDIPNWEWSSVFREIGQLKGSPLTLFFELPAGLPQALFPLDFVIESDRQNIQNAYQGNAVVQSVSASQSLFYNDPTLKDADGKPIVPTTTRIQYVKTVTWEDYFGGLSDELVGRGSSIVRCRFLTITDLAQDGIGGTGANSWSETTLRVSNPYFDRPGADGNPVYHQDGFTRNASSSDPSPRFWYFTSGIWDELMYEMNKPHTNDTSAASDAARRDYLLDESYGGIDELFFVEGGRYTGTGNNRRVTATTLSNATDENGYRYVQTSDAGDKLRHTHTYDKNNIRTIRLEVVSTDTNGAPMAPTIVFSTVVGGTITVPTPDTVAWSKDERYTVYRYDITVPKDVTNLVLDVQGSGLRFYEVDFYPRWDEYETD